MALETRDLHVAVGGREILRGVTLKLEPRRIIALMGPNGSGKSTLLYTIIGRPGYEPVKGSILLDGEDITGLPAEERSLRGVMLGFQDPVGIPGVRLSTLVIAAWNKRQGRRDLLRPDPKLLPLVHKTAEMLGLRRELLYRDVNVGFSGGEKKRSEMLQLLVLQPRYALLDEPDSGLDVDGVRKVAEAAAQLADRGAGLLIVTHYARILRFIEPDTVAVMVNGRIVETGGPELAAHIDRHGYEKYLAKTGEA